MSAAGNAIQARGGGDEADIESNNPYLTAWGRRMKLIFSQSGAVCYMDPFEDERIGDYDLYAMGQRTQPHGGQLMMTTQVTTRAPPGFDGKTSWFAFGDTINDWCDIRKFESEKWGPALRDRLEGEHCAQAVT